MNPIVFLLLLTVSGSMTDFVPLIHGGYKAVKHQFPFLVSLRKLDSTGIYKHDCGATILSNRFLVTAAHCWDNKLTLDDYIISCGPHKKEDEGEVYSIEEFIKHPGYDANRKFNDIALIKLKTPIGFSEYVKPVEMGREYIKENIDVIAIGWGESEVSFKTLSYLLWKIFEKNDSFILI